MRIDIREPDNDQDYKAILDTEVMDVTISEAFKGPEFVSANDEHLIVLHRDTGYELYYLAPGMSDPIMIEAKGGVVTLDNSLIYDETGWMPAPEPPPLDVSEAATPE